jgi:DMSO/TMAO reductase YedYZ molybdopterin-dependent catalytic subunit
MSSDSRPSIWRGAVLGASVSLGAVPFFLLGQLLAGLPNGAYVIFEWVAGILPGSVVSFGIDALVALLKPIGVNSLSSVAKAAEKGMALALFIVLGAATGAALRAAARKGVRALPAWGALAGVALFAGTAFMKTARSPGQGAISFLWLGGVFLAWGVVMGRVCSPPAVAPTPLAQERRLWLAAAVTGSLGSLLALVLARLRRFSRGPVARAPRIDVSTTSGPAASPPASVLAARPPPVPGTRPEITDNDRFYRIDINLRAPEIDVRQWNLELAGLVDRPRVLTLEEIRARPQITQAITLECISNPVGGDLIGTSLWTGVRLNDLLREAGLRSGAAAVFVQAADGFYETVPMDEAMDDRTLLVHAMNGVPLAADHGFPLRIYIPNHYGMKQPKWIRRLEVIDEWRPGYWVERGWDRLAIPQTTAVVDVAARASERGDAPVLLGGIAFAGTRGVSRVEVQVDDGPWSSAALRTPSLSPLTWVEWRHAWRGPRGRHVFRVRAYDGAGHRQPTQPQPVHPSGATGIHAIERTV